jgi:MoaA/NifB/PqqE/SkfB family radical SAM enzyme
MSLFKHVKKYGKFTSRVISNKGKTPLYMIFFVTSYCNLKCKHCFYWKELNVKRDELTLEEIEKIAKNMDDLMFLRLTGGEPTLRKDLPEIVKIFYDNNNIRSVGINTSGFLTQKILKDARKILDICPDLELEVCISIDDFEKFHDLNRGIPNTYKNAISTIKGLKEIKKEYGSERLRLNCGICVSKYNQARLDNIFDDVLVPLGVDFLQTTLIRGKPKDPDLMGVDIGKYKSFLRRTRAYNSRRKYHGLYISSNVKDKLMSSIISNTVQKRRFQGIYCNAGNKVGVLYSGGDLFPCELLEGQKIGNLRDHNYDFRALWNSQKANEVRKFIRDTKCFCTHECFMTSNLLLDPKNLVSYVKTYASSKINDSDISGEKEEIEHLVKSKSLT